jgi:membrane protease subunit HflC
MVNAMNKLVPLLAILGAAAFVLISSIYTVSEVEQMIITQFGKPVGEPVTTAGLKIKIPFIQQVNPIEKRVLEWDGNPSDMPTKDKLYISVDLFARWRITDPLQYFLRIRDERSAQSRLDDILGSETRNAVAKHELIEIIRTTRDRVPLRDTLLTEAERDLNMGTLVPIQKGRKLVEQEIFAAAAEKVEVFGIELLDIRFKRINYNESVRPKIYDRMISERRQIAERFLSEGNGEAARIRGNRVRDLNKIQSEAYREVEEIRGLADAKATEIWKGSMNTRRPKFDVFAYALICLAAFAVPAELALAQEGKGALPSNATAKTYGSGWECDRGYRKNAGSCIAVTLPVNAYLTDSNHGVGWACQHGFKQNDVNCLPVALPANAFLSGRSGDRWSCGRGFRQQKNYCEAISVPANGYLTERSSGSGWTCERGYRAMADNCVAIVVPENAYLTPSSYDAGWECDRGYRKVGGACNAIALPSNAYLSGRSYGHGWECARGYRKVEEACVAVKVPQNAHLDFAGHNWDCNKPYRKRMEACTSGDRND